jgi:DNA gyrase subunit A
MKIDRPDLSKVSLEVLAYIQSLEDELESLRITNGGKTHQSARSLAPSENDIAIELSSEIEPSEPPNTFCVITATQSGIVKRTPRYLYSRQNRGGMGIFDLDTPNEEHPAILVMAEQSQTLLALTNTGRAFRLPVSAIPELPIHGRGASILSKLNLVENEHLAAITSEQASGYLALATETGMVRLLRHHVFGEYMKPGISLYDFRNYGSLASACWSTGSQDLFLTTRSGRAIRFSEKDVPPQGILGIRLQDPDIVVSITAVNSVSGVFLLGADGKGTIRLMEGFAANKSPGAGGKIAMATDHLICALSTDNKTDVFIISRLSKIIRFRLEQIPVKDGVVQGVVCMSLRADQPVTAILA